MNVCAGRAKKNKPHLKKKKIEKFYEVVVNLSVELFETKIVIEHLMVLQFDPIDIEEINVEVGYFLNANSSYLTNEIDESDDVEHELWLT